MRPAEPAGAPTRRAALRLLDAVLRRGLPLEAALSASTGVLKRPEDRGLARAIASETLRRLPDLDALIDSATRQPLPADAKARFALRIALVQALAMGTPPHAAIATALPLVEGGPRRLVHGVFGALMRRGASLPEPPHFPEAVARRWAEAWGEEAMERARAGLAGLPSLDLTLADASVTRSWAERLGAISFAPGHLRLPHCHSDESRNPFGPPSPSSGEARMDADFRQHDRKGDVTALPGYDEGAWWVQDFAASLPARLIGPGKGKALDLCAAPGGKTLQLAAADWDVTAVELAPARLARLRENLARTGLAAELVEADVTAWEPAVPADAVLLDAPCSATGIFRRHPDVLHRVRPSAVAQLAETQAAMLARAAKWVKPGGTLVYAVCSLEPEEGEGVARGIGLSVDPIRADELPAGLAPTPEGFLRVPPGALSDAGGCDGFFVARFKA
ncbi:MAG TPA: RsmB/NOP family class I SAM-dependent RNA methyltransferase [Sphingomonas sp.]|nr:RsmB/NOP family class I SAM-dependent RNA methyltransferase [Sphingomonas sp.]